VEAVRATVVAPAPAPLPERVAEVLSDAIPTRASPETAASEEKTGLRSCSFCGRQSVFARRSFLRRTERWRSG
jgi:hypothetical protein